jgi:hypothetical protein
MFSASITVLCKLLPRNRAVIRLYAITKGLNWENCFKKTEVGAGKIVKQTGSFAVAVLGNIDVAKLVKDASCQ